jgi:fructose-1-phosphate kinase PfkB-like protein
LLKLGLDLGIIRIEVCRAVRRWTLSAGVGMKKTSKIVTVGLCPSWDMVCRFDGLEWGEHKLVGSSSCRPAGKALNISRALAWIGEKNTAGGLWGRDDYEEMRKAMRELRGPAPLEIARPRRGPPPTREFLTGLVRVKMTAVEGATRRNVTVVDTVRDREMHLRFPCGLVSRKALRQLREDLKAIVKSSSVCVFAGLMPESKFLPELLRIVEDCSGRGAKIVVDTYGEALRRIVDTGRAWIIKPNVAELRELLGEVVADRPASLAKAARRLLDKVGIVLVSRGRKGAVAVTRQGAWQGRCIGRGRVLSTVGCGDYLLGGFLKGLKGTSDVGLALKVALKVATAKAWGWTEEKTWGQARQRIEIEGGRV